MSQLITPAEFQRRYELQKEYIAENGIVTRPVPLVSVWVITYQHVKYLRECLDGILKQKVDFNYELVLGEDGSTDGTIEICKEYVEKYPNIVRLFLRDRNVTVLYDKDGQFRKSLNGIFTTMACHGKYVAMCEGDDYWTDPYKLQKQVDFLEMNPQYSGCLTNTTVQFVDEGKSESFKVPYSEITAKQLYVSNYLGHNTCTALFQRSHTLNLPAEMLSSPWGDWFLWLHLSSYGPLKVLDDVTAVYRYTGSGLWSGSNPEKAEKTTLAFFKNRSKLDLKQLSALTLEEKTSLLRHLVTANVHQRRYAIALYVVGYFNQYSILKIPFHIRMLFYFAARIKFNKLAEWSIYRLL